ncbi:hypothetical protein BE221DRAFT_192950 [Ostreococcus tauri]|uniref:CGL160/ATPI domain-containing protein n=1 Tax=Ostreococcus tauri TaxID=70448 RepID=A0A1Y5IB49_OSTTA|nr:hypothetical protein BE221DRAFT_192950 [Ostreococcus tauri]
MESIAHRRAALDRATTAASRAGDRWVVNSRRGRRTGEARSCVARATNRPSDGDAVGDASTRASESKSSTVDDAATAPAWRRANSRANQKPIWETDIEAEFERVERLKREREESRRANASGGVGLSRARMLDDMSLDLSAALRSKKREGEEAEVKEPKALTDGTPSMFTSSTVNPALKYVDKDGRVKGEPTALDLATTNKAASKYNLAGWNYAPTRAEKGRWQREWEKAERAKAARTPGYRPASSLSIKSKIKDATFMPVKAFADLTDEEKAARRAADAAKYAKIKEDLLLTTAGMAGSGAIAAFAVGGNNMGYSWLLGAAGAILYVRLLSGKAESEQAGQGGPPSILVPVILFMALNRWNAFFSADVGVTLTPIPMLLAFFTYKPASILQALKDVIENPEDAETEA